MSIRFRHIANMFFLSALLINCCSLPAMPLKYQKEIDVFNTPQEEWNKFAALDNKKSYRWVFPDAADDRNFNPRYRFKEVYDYHKNKGDLTFKGWALSFFCSQKEAKESFDFHSRHTKNAHKRLGTNIAEGLIQLTDGLSEIDSDKYGHFNHFEYEGTDFYKDRFTVVANLLDKA